MLDFCCVQTTATSPSWWPTSRTTTGAGRSWRRSPKTSSKTLLRPATWRTTPLHPEEPSEQRPPCTRSGALTAVSVLPPAHLPPPPPVAVELSLLSMGGHRYILVKTLGGRLYAWSFLCTRSRALTVVAVLPPTPSLPPPPPVPVRHSLLRTGSDHYILVKTLGGCVYGWSFFSRHPLMWCFWPLFRCQCHHAWRWWWVIVLFILYPFLGSLLLSEWTWWRYTV